MPAERTTMRHVREVLRLKFVPTREIARRIGVAASTVRATIKRLEHEDFRQPAETRDRLDELSAVGAQGRSRCIGQIGEDCAVKAAIRRTGRIG
jgi:hypothetical protein